MDLLKHIPHSREHAISRFKLADMYGVSERFIRLEIERLRREGHDIIPSPKGGYLTYLPMRKKVAEAKGIRITNVRQHFRRLGMGDLEGQQRIEVS